MAADESLNAPPDAAADAADAAAQKRQVAAAALEWVQPGDVLGVGSGSTVACFIEALGAANPGVERAVAASEVSADALRDVGIEVVALNDVPGLQLYVDGADEFDPRLNLIKGGGAALTGEKIVATAARTFVCIVDASKQVQTLGAFPLPVEVIAMARELVARQLRALGGDPVLRAGLTDHGNPILDVHGLTIENPRALEIELDALPGVLTCGIFARRRADIVLMASPRGVQRFE